MHNCIFLTYGSCSILILLNETLCTLQFQDSFVRVQNSSDGGAHFSSHLLLVGENFVYEILVLLVLYLVAAIRTAVDRVDWL